MGHSGGFVEEGEDAIAALRRALRAEKTAANPLTRATVAACVDRIRAAVRVGAERRPRPFHAHVLTPAVLEAACCGE